MMTKLEMKLMNKIEKYARKLHISSDRIEEMIEMSGNDMKLVVMDLRDYKKMVGWCI